jgi:MFS family permease
MTRPATAAAPSGYLTFARANLQFLGFGFLLALASSFGQTFYIGVFGPEIRSEFGLNHAEWGTIYMAGTLLSAAVLPFTGSWIDRMPLKRYALLVSIGLALACLGAALCPAAGFLIAVVFMLRHMGQGLASHTSLTATVKHFRRDRGKAVAIVSLGFPAGRAVLPVAAVALIALLGWRTTYLMAGIATAALLIPAVLWLLRNPGRAAEKLSPAIPDHLPVPEERSLTLTQVLTHPFFYLILPGTVAPSIIETALFFHQLEVAAMKGWSAGWVTAGYAVFSVTTTLFSMAAGPLVDRVGATRLLWVILIPYIFGILILAYMDDPLWAWVYLALSGATGGLRQTIAPVMWAEFGGTRHIGAIRSMAATLSVFASALGPPAMGFMMIAGVSLQNMVLGTVIYLILATILIWVACSVQWRH